ATMKATQTMDQPRKRDARIMLACSSPRKDASSRIASGANTGSPDSDSVPSVRNDNEDAMLDPGECERARVNRDRRYDGRFFTGVRTTKVYCRPRRLPRERSLRRAQLERLVRRDRRPIRRSRLLREAGQLSVWLHDHIRAQRARCRAVSAPDTRN